MQKILIACEESQAVANEFRKLGLEAWSCDIQPCSGGHPEWHLQQDVTPLLTENWDLIIAFPPCTFLSNAQAYLYHPANNTETRIEKRKAERDLAYQFVKTIANSKCPRIAIENPVGYLNTFWRKPNQIINPYQFGERFSKRTCLWLKGLPLLKPTSTCACNRKGISNSYFKCDCIKLVSYVNKFAGSKLRSKTFPGIAKAMAMQWGKYLLDTLK